MFVDFVTVFSIA